jgi:hypothetical protein
MATMRAVQEEGEEGALVSYNVDKKVEELSIVVKEYLSNTLQVTQCSIWKC